MSIRRRSDMLDGVVHPSNSFGDITIIGYTSCNEVHFRFHNTQFIGTARAAEIRKGQVYDPTAKTNCGVGFMGVGEFDSSHPSYTHWYNMIYRCYSSNKQRCYIGIDVDECWHNFQNFATWYTANPPLPNQQLDKDILGFGSYGPDKCMWVDQVENVMEVTDTRTLSWVMRNTTTGEERTVYNQSEFARDIGAYQSAVRRVINQEPSNKTVKGWEYVKTITSNPV